MPWVLTDHRCTARACGLALVISLRTAIADPTPAGAGRVPEPLPEHPGQIYVEGEDVRVRVPEDRPAGANRWRVVDDRGNVVRAGTTGTDASGDAGSAPLSIGTPGVGWYRIEWGTADAPAQAWTTAAVLRRWVEAPPADTPVAVDAAMAWFARGDAVTQRQFASLAALAGVRWVRDRLRWGDLQPDRGAWVAGPTTYDTSADAQKAVGLEVLQVFHDTPTWAREDPRAGGRLAPDLRDVHDFARGLAVRFRGRVTAWEPWNEANVASFGGHTVDQMCSWQKAAWWGFRAGDPAVTVGWNATAAVPTPAHTEGVLANETWPYFDTYNLHTYDWSHAYLHLWEPARRAAAGRPLWITEADRGTPHLKNPPWFDQDPRLERLKAEWIAQSYAASLFAGADRHFHFILGHYHEPQGVQFGLLRLDLTPRPAYVALAAVGRCLAGARSLGRWRPADSVELHAFRARPEGRERDVLVVWAEREMDWEGRGQTTAAWRLPADLPVEEVVDYLGRSLGTDVPFPVTSAPVFVVLPPGTAATLPLEAPPRRDPPRAGIPSPVVLQMALPRSAVGRVEDLPWSEGYTYLTRPGTTLPWTLRIYNFGTDSAQGRLRVARHPEGWDVSVEEPAYAVVPGGRVERAGTLRVPSAGAASDGWIVVEGDGSAGVRPVVAWRVRAGP